MPFKSKWNYKGKQLVETRTGDGPQAREQAIISLGPALEWNPQERIAVEAAALLLNSDKKHSLLLLIFPSPLEQSRVAVLWTAELSSQGRWGLPVQDLPVFLAKKSCQCTFCSQPAAHSAALTGVCLSYTLFSYFSPLLFPSYTTSVWKQMSLKIIGEKLLFKAGSSQTGIDTCKTGK